MYRYQGLFRALAYSLLLISSSSTALAQSTANQTLDELLESINTLSAEVLQLIIESDGGVLEESAIQMHLKRPNGFYWETLDPFPELVVTDGSTLWNYQPDLEQVVLEDWDSSRSELAAKLLSGDTEGLHEEYTVVLRENDDEEFDTFDLIPIAADSVYDVITINFIEAELGSIRVSNKNGQRTVWEFQQVQRNPDLDENLFSFDIPADIEVIDNSSGA